MTISCVPGAPPAPDRPPSGFYESVADAGFGLPADFSRHIDSELSRMGVLGKCDFSFYPDLGAVTAHVRGLHSCRDEWCAIDITFHNGEKRAFFQAFFSDPVFAAAEILSIS